MLKSDKIQEGVLGQKKYDIAEYIEGGEVVAGIVETLSDALSCEPGHLEPLYDSIDPDGLSALLRPREHGIHQPDLTILFEYAGHKVIVRGDGIVSIGNKGTRWVGASSRKETPEPNTKTKSGNRKGRAD